MQEIQGETMTTKHFGILCQRCIAQGKPQNDSWIPTKTYQLHVATTHPEAIEEQALSVITKATKKVDYVLSRFPEAFNNEGVLVEKVLRFWPWKEASVTYNKETGHVITDAPFETTIYLYKHVGTITRLGRAWRAKHPEAAPSEAKQLERDIEEDFSRKHWYMERKGLLG